MEIDVVLFLLRIVSGALLIAFLGVLFFVLMRDYRSATGQTQSYRRRFGRLVALTNIEGNLLETGQTYPLMPLTSLGRSPTNTIVINDDFASSEHATIALRNNQWWLEDRNSRNGTLLNGDKTEAPVIITQGDVIGIGNLSFRIELE
ncbi:FHA domain-containing protein [Phototrophicus methaneseepsis]|uniref:FHA domain-containing protein n=1 Tax=Phototrophicus methaneseepsis TaxID=2710758 RepID=A0A7S8E5X2_9CHLR|nr:FHA domain-containing protein [Phototrophicus methaneseepsis]QPC80869.1 FHA domain-containing protein [Phototrophicus methaneseepsis]